MKNIAITVSQATGLSPIFETVREITIEDTPLGQGGFGEVYRAVSFDGRTCAPQVVKLLTENGQGTAARGLDTIRELQRGIRIRNDEFLKTTGRSVIDHFPALYAIPQFSFEGVLNGKPVKGYCANDLGKAGYEDFGRILDDDIKIGRLQALPLTVKLQIAHQLVNAFQFLSTHLLFIHADIKAEALFIDMQRSRCAIIDFDSGAVARDPSDKPSTFGTKQDWLAPEITKQLDASGNSACIVKVDLLSDIWSVNIAIHYLLFGFHPLFFLTEISERSLKAYRQHFTWPDVAPGFRYFRTDYAAIYGQYVSFLKTRFSPEVLSRLAFTLNQGYYTPSARTTYGQWTSVLSSVNRLEIKQFVADRTIVSDPKPVRLSWEVNGAARWEIVGIGDLTGQTSVDVRVTRDTTFTLRATRADGVSLSRALSIQFKSIPAIIHSFTSTTLAVAAQRPATLMWNVRGAARIEIDQGIGDVTTRSSVSVLPRRDTTFTLKAANAFGHIVTATLTITVPKVAPRIDVFESDQSVLYAPVPVELRWRVSEDASEVAIEGVGQVAKEGRVRLNQTRDKVYVLRATSFFGSQSVRRVEVKVSRVPPTIEAFTGSPSFVREGDITELRWQVSGAGEVRIEPKVGAVALKGHVRIKVLRDAEFRLIATSCFGVSAEATWRVRLLRESSLKSATGVTLDDGKFSSFSTAPRLSFGSPTALSVARTAMRREIGR